MANLLIDTREIDGVLVMDIKGRMDTVGNTSTVLRQTVGRALTEGRRHFVFNLEDVTLIDSHALSALIETYAAIRKQQGEAGMAGLKGRWLQLMVITKLVSVFEVFPTLDKAIASLSSRAIPC